MPIKNSYRFLHEALATIALQSMRDFELIIVDGASTDPTRALLEKLFHVTWVSEPDSGYVEALHKGLALARGRFVVQCCGSDGFLDGDWFNRAVRLLMADPSISLAWGFPRQMSESGTLGNLTYRYYREVGTPSAENFFVSWLATGLWLPEGNFVVHRRVLAELFPRPEEMEFGIEPYLEFNYRFHESRLLAGHIPTVANFGRYHADSNSVRQDGADESYHMLKRYRRQVRHSRSFIRRQRGDIHFQNPDFVNSDRYLTHSGLTASLRRERNKYALWQLRQSVLRPARAAERVRDAIR